MGPSCATFAVCDLSQCSKVVGLTQHCRIISGISKWSIGSRWPSLTRVASRGLLEVPSNKATSRNRGSKLFIAKRSSFALPLLIAIDMSPRLSYLVAKVFA